ncbi:MAG: FG-GAP repeat protein [Chitinophagaceae bacterium]|nr:FG-GAP repeat protein [Chitinophagaceae bacterium]
MVFDSTWQKMYVYTKSGWRPLSFDEVTNNSNVLTPFARPSSLSAGGWYGFSVDVEDDFAMVGAPGDSVNNMAARGTVYCYVFDGESWVASQELTAPDGKAGDYYGAKVVIHGEWAFVGATRADIDENVDQGSVYVYKRDGNLWSFHSKLLGNNATTGDLFGSDFSVVNSTLVIGSTRDDIGTNQDQGSVYVFSLQGNSWVQTQKMFTQVGGAATDLFGKPYIVNDSLLFVGSDHSANPFGLCQNAIYVYAKQGGVWTQRAKIVAPDPVDAFEAFGYSFYMVGQRIMIGAVFHNTPSNNKDRGAVYVFERTDTTGFTWNFVQKLAPPDSRLGDSFGDYFGNFISGEGDQMFVSAHFEDVNGATDQGAVYTYRLVNGNWVLQPTVFTRPGFISNEVFGFSTAISKGWLLIGGYGRNQFTGEAFFIKL